MYVSDSKVQIRMAKINSVMILSSSFKSAITAAHDMEVWCSAVFNEAFLAIGKLKNKPASTRNIVWTQAVRLCACVCTSCHVCTWYEHMWCVSDGEHRGWETQRGGPEGFRFVGRAVCVHVRACQSVCVCVCVSACVCWPPVLQGGPRDQQLSLCPAGSHHCRMEQVSAGSWADTHTQTHTHTHTHTHCKAKRTLSLSCPPQSLRLTFLYVFFFFLFVCFFRTNQTGNL